MSTAELAGAARARAARPEAAPETAPPPAPGSALLPLLLTVLPILMVLTARLWFQTDVRAVDGSSTLIATTSLVHGLVLFILLGGQRSTMAGFFMAASAAIVGLSGLLVIPDPYFLDVPRPSDYLNTALTGSALAQIAIGALCLRADRTAPVPVVLLDGRTARITQIAGVVALVLTTSLGDRLGEFLDGFAFAAILLVCTASLMSPRGLRSPLNVVLVLAALVTFPTLVISGTGRLRAIALVLAVGYVFFLRYGRRWLKTLGVLMSPVMFLALGVWRKAYEESLTGQHSSDTGLSSMFVGIGNFGTVIHVMEEGVDPTLGLSLLSPLRAALPASIVPDWIPEANGYALAKYTDPELYGSGFSTVVTIYGEAWWIAGPLGLLLAVPLLALLLTKLDDWAVAAYSRAADGPRSLLLFLLVASFVGGVGDLVWSGFHTWVVRMYGRIAALLILAFLTLYLPSRLVRPRFVSFAGPARGPSGARPGEG